MKIFEYNPKYSIQVTDLFYDTIHVISSADYTQEEIDIWAPTPINYEKWAQRLLKKQPLLVFSNNELVGFGELEIDGRIDCFYVHKQYQRKGVGRFLMENIENKAKKKGIKKLHAKVSITAKPFFSAMGFISLKPNLAIKGKFMLKNYLMEKEI